MRDRRIALDQRQSRTNRLAGFCLPGLASKIFGEMDAVNRTAKPITV